MPNSGGFTSSAVGSGSILTDSGGFQVYSLSDIRKVDEQGVRFRSHTDGRMHHLTPERSIEVQELLGSDISMVFDECIGLPAPRSDAASAMRRSLRWAARSREAFRGGGGRALFGIQQGGSETDLRAESAEGLAEIGFDGYAIGGLAVGEPQEERFRVLDETVPLLPAERPRYLMGVGKPSDIVGAVVRGVDMFDCVLPSRSGRTAQAWTRRGSVNLRNARHACDTRPLDPECTCPCCSSTSRAFLHHLVRTKEIGASVLLTLHNLHYYQELMAGMRKAIESGRLEAFRMEFLAAESVGDLPPLA